jgi:hypothetical protein
MRLHTVTKNGQPAQPIQEFQFSARYEFFYVKSGSPTYSTKFQRPTAITKKTLANNNTTNTNKQHLPTPQYVATPPSSLFLLVVTQHDHRAVHILLCSQQWFYFMKERPFVACHHHLHR